MQGETGEFELFDWTIGRRLARAKEVGSWQDPVEIGICLWW